jgi:hypothetical protein
MKKYILFLVVASIAMSCRPTKKVQSIQTAIIKKDTAQVVIVKENPIVDSVVIVKDILKRITQQKIDFKTFNAKIKVEYNGQEESQNVTAYLSIVKDSIIYVQIKGFLGIVGLQAKITSIKQSISPWSYSECNCNKHTQLWMISRPSRSRLEYCSSTNKTKSTGAMTF